MRIIFMGTPEFAVASLDSLIVNHYNVVAVVTAPDKPAGRGQQLQQSAVKKYATERNLKILQPENLKNPDFINELVSLKADLQLVVAFRMLPEVVWNMPSAGTYNLHASLLPKYRGAAPINWAIINGDDESGVTTFKLKHEIDTGNILFQEKVSIKPNDNAGDLHDVLMNVGAKLVLKTVRKIEEHFLSGVELPFMIQDNSKVSHAPKLSKETCRIDWTLPGVKLTSFIRGLSPYPTAYTYIKNDNNKLLLVKIFCAEYKEVNHINTNGLLITDGKNFLHVCCVNGVLEIMELQLEGKKKLHITEFLKGFKINSTTMFV
jgi:methionyl-tRNA formyltransferase